MPRLNSYSLVGKCDLRGLMVHPLPQINFWILGLITFNNYFRAETQCVLGTFYIYIFQGLWPRARCYRYGTLQKGKSMQNHNQLARVAFFLISISDCRQRCGIDGYQVSVKGDLLAAMKCAENRNHDHFSAAHFQLRILRGGSDTKV